MNKTKRATTKKGFSRPLSQHGFNRIPKNPKQRAFAEGGVKVERAVLDKVNEAQAENRKRVIHPTKGFRKLSAKRSMAESIVAQIKTGQMPFSMKAIKRELSNVR